MHKSSDSVEPFWKPLFRDFRGTKDFALALGEMATGENVFGSKI